MKSNKALLTFGFFLVTGIGYSQLVPPSADSVLREATSRAEAEKKNVLIIFHASWCGWCHKMDSALNDPACKKYFDANYVTRHLVVYESKDKKNLENAGVYELLAKYHGTEEGIPFWLVFDKEGKLLADSERRPGGTGTKGENVGCPATAEEVQYFIDVLKKTSRISRAEEIAVEKRFRQNED